MVDLYLASNRPIAMVAVRLSDVAPDDKATRVTYGMLNLTHRTSRQHPEPMPVGTRQSVQVKLNDIAQTFPAGHRIRVSISTSYWPLAWPPPEPVRLTIHTGASALHLPVRPPRADDAHLGAFEPPEGSAPAKSHVIAPGHHNWLVHRDLAADASTLEVINDNGLVHLDDIDLRVERRAVEKYTSQGDDIASVRGETRHTRRLTRGDWNVRTETRTVLRSTQTDFQITAELDAYENDVRVRSLNWNILIPRDFI